MIQWHTQAGNINTNIKVKIDITLPEISTTKIVTWNCYVDDYSKVRYDIIFTINILIVLGLNPIFSKHVIKAYYVPFKGSMSPMVDLGTY